MKRFRTEGGKKRGGAGRLSAQLSSVRFKCGLMIALTTLVLMMMFCLSCTPKRYNVQVNTISHETITATRDIDDRLSTEEARRKAADEVRVNYTPNDGAKEETLRLFEDVMNELRLVRAYGEGLRRLETEDAYTVIRDFTDEEVENAKSMLSMVTLDSYQIKILLRTDEKDFSNMETSIRTTLKDPMNETIIRQGEEESAIRNITQFVSFGGVKLTLLQNIVPAVLRSCVQPNMVVDEEALQLSREKAMENVATVGYKQGQIIIQRGEIVKQNQYEVLKALGLLKTSDSVDIKLYAGGALTVLVSMLVFLVSQFLLDRERLLNIRSTGVIMLVLLLNMAVCIGIDKLVNILATPLLVSAMLLTGLLGWRTGLSAGMGMVVMLSGLAAGGNNTTSVMVQLIMVGIIGSLLSVVLLRGKSQRMRVILCGGIAGAAGVVCMIAISLMTASNQSELLSSCLWSMGGAIISSVITLSVQPVFEGAFNLATPSKLLELGNPKQPLLRRLQMEAPGTYHHSIIVANLAEAAAEKIGANPLLARTGAYFHDIGKLKRPLYFAENQMGENPHDHTDPYVSAAIVTTHTRDGLILAQKHHLPQEIQDIIVEHHGDTPVMYFYHKALQSAGGKPVDISDFRYDGRRPTTREAAIIMLADTTEAAVRSMSEPTPESIQRFIDKLVRGKLEDGQLSNAPLTLHDIDQICEAFCTVLNGVFHERIEYPNQEIPRRVAGQSEKNEEKQPAAAPAKPDEATDKAASPAREEEAGDAAKTAEPSPARAAETAQSPSDADAPGQPGQAQGAADDPAAAKEEADEPDLGA